MTRKYVRTKPIRRQSPAHLKSGSPEYARWWKIQNPDKNRQHKRKRHLKLLLEKGDLYPGGAIMRRAHEREAAIKEAHARGLSNQEISLEMGLLHTTVTKAVHRLGLTKNAHPPRQGNSPRVWHALRDIRQGLATPKWVNIEDILEVYRRCETRRAAGEDVVVDHIIPINGRDVCGLHVSWNLQIIPALENSKKGTTVDPNIDLI